MSDATNSHKFDLPKRYQGSTKSVWVEYIQLAAQYKPLNLGQGFPDYHAPKYATDALAAAANSINPLANQYTRGFGHPRLVQALSDLYSQLVNRTINPMTEVLVTVGAYEALYATIQGHVDEGDEVIIIEPFFDCYEPMVKAAGGIAKFIPLKPKLTEAVISSADWTLDNKELESLFNEKTKMIIINTPHNPLGKVMSLEELETVANLCKKWNVLCVSDEVYEHIVFKPYEHIRICTLPGMWERTITIGSAGKTFSLTGWKIGWAYGPDSLLANLQMVHQNSVYTCCTPIQEAIAVGFETELKRIGSPECYFNSISDELMAKRDFMAKFLADIGMNPTVPQGGYFMVADWSSLASKVDLSQETDTRKDYRFTKWMTRTVGLQGIPPSAFYSEPNKSLGENFVRYCFFKKDDTLQKAAYILEQWKDGLQ
ncbi:kynurenine aminotransferase isoform X4 [Toxorhynchites rutilus septentrionalis]|nr:kynurenine aminotransferase isoform X4 [Toxorhynchites rutilus septentrionalis]XP_055620327.1 kynurenine aminotransferase isoform X4 [Toxorhynchites rutilus septentrionalis]